MNGDVLTRERYVVTLLRQQPEMVEPLDALAAVVWPTPFFEGVFGGMETPSKSRRPRQHPCRGCGGRLDAFTEGCTRCQERHRIRKHREAQRAA